MSNLIQQITNRIDLMQSKTDRFMEGCKHNIPGGLKDRLEKKLEKIDSDSKARRAKLEAKVKEMEKALPPSIIRTHKNIVAESNAALRSNLKSFIRNGRKDQEIKLFESDEHFQIYMTEASALTGSGAGVGGRSAYDPVFTALRQINPMRAVSKALATDGSVYQWRVKSGNAGATWGYNIQDNGAPTTENMNIWQIPMKDINCQFPIRTAALDDIDGLESNIVSDMMAEFEQAIGLSMIQNNDQGLPTLPYGGSDGLRGLNQYAGANATYTGGLCSVAAFGTSGSALNNGLHSLATYDQLVTNGNAVGAGNIQYQDIFNFIWSLPTQYQTPRSAFMVHPTLLGQIRGLVDKNGTPIFERTSPLVYDGSVGEMLGYKVYANQYLDAPAQATTGAAGTRSLFPMYFGDFNKGHNIVNRLGLVLRRYAETLPGSITFYSEARAATSVADPFAIIRYRSTATAS